MVKGQFEILIFLTFFQIFGSFCANIGEPCAYSSECSSQNSNCILDDYIFSGTCACHDGFYFDEIDECRTLEEIGEICQATDRYGLEWISKINKTAQKKCCHIPGHLGYIYWECGLDGQFIGDTNYEGCSTEWISYSERDLNKKIFDAITPQGLENTNFVLSKAALRNLIFEFESNVELATGDSEEINDLYYFGLEIEKMAQWVKKVTGKIKCEYSYDDFEPIHEEFSGRTLDSILKYEKPWEDFLEDKGKKSRAVTDLLITYEMSLADFITSRINQTQIEEEGKVTKRLTGLGEEGIYAEGAAINRSNQNFPQIFPSDFDYNTDNYVILPRNWSHFLDDETDEKNQFWQDDNEDVCIKNNEMKVLFYFLDGKKLESKFTYDLLEEPDTKDIKILSEKFVSLTLSVGGQTKRVTNLLGEKVKFKFKHQQKLKKGDVPKCAFWNYETLVWSGQNCQLVESESDADFTTCECDHLSSFAVLMGGSDKDVDNFLLYLSTILSCFSAACFLFTIIILHYSNKNFNSWQSTVTKNICVCYFCANICLILLNPEFLNMPQWLCGTSGILIHYFFICAFVWMAIMGVHIFKMVAFVFETTKNSIVVHSIIGYGVPAIYVGLIAGIGRENAYNFKHDSYQVESDYCWLIGGYIWTFLGPVGIVLIMNFFIFIYTILKSSTVFKKDEIKTKVSNNRLNVLGWVSLSFLLGVNWVFGYIQMVDNSGFAAYIFTILNASQGIFLLAFNLYLKKNFRHEAMRITTLSTSRSRYESSNARKSRNMETSRSEATRTSTKERATQANSINN